MATRVHTEGMRRHITLPLDLDQAAQQAAKDASITLSELCQAALRDRLDHQGAEQEPQDAAVRLDRIEGELRQLRNVVLLALALSVGLVMLGGTANWLGEAA